MSSHRISRRPMLIPSASSESYSSESCPPPPPSSACCQTQHVPSKLTLAMYDEHGDHWQHRTVRLWPWKEWVGASRRVGCGGRGGCRATVVGAMSAKAAKAHLFQTRETRPRRLVIRVWTPNPNNLVAAAGGKVLSRGRPRHRPDRIDVALELGDNLEPRRWHSCSARGGSRQRRHGARWAGWQRSNRSAGRTETAGSSTLRRPATRTRSRSMARRRSCSRGTRTRPRRMTINPLKKLEDCYALPRPSKYTRGSVGRTRRVRTPRGAWHAWWRVRPSRVISPFETPDVPPSHGTAMGYRAPAPKSA